MIIYLATDHAGFTHKEYLKGFLKERGHEVVDCGAYTCEALDDFPDFIIKAAAAVNKEPETVRAIIFGGSGQGEAMLANRFAHVRAAVYYGGNRDILTLSRTHNNANVLSLGARFLDPEELPELVELWLNTTFSREEKYHRRNKKITFGHRL